MKGNVVESPTKVIAGVLGLSGFIIAAIAGLAAGNDALVILARAILAMLACNIVGYAIGRTAQHTVGLYLDQFKKINPRPVKPDDLIHLEDRAKAHAEAEQAETQAPAADNTAMLGAA